MHANLNHQKKIGLTLLYNVSSVFFCVFRVHELTVY